MSTYVHKIIVALSLLALITAAYGQNTYVSKPIADAISAGKFYMKLQGDADIEMAALDEEFLTRTQTMGTSTTILGSHGNTFILDEDAKTWSSMPAPAGMAEMGRLTFVKQYSCKLEGEDGWYCDEYKSSKGGMKVRFFYNTSKVAAIELDEEMGVLSLVSFSNVIPQNMYFCLGNDWTQDSSTDDIQSAAIASAGIDMDQIKKQMMAELDGADLPPGMTKDDIMAMVNKRLGGTVKKQGTKQGAKPAKPAGPLPPQCDTPWHDTGTFTNLACGSSTVGNLSLSNMQAVSSPVFASNMQAPADDNNSGRWAYSQEGVAAALARIRTTIEKMSDSDALYYIVQRNNDIMGEIAGETATGETLEEAIATTIAYPTSLTLTNTGLLYMMKDDPEAALQYFLEAEKIDPKNAIVLVNIAEAYLSLGNLLLAERYAGLSLQQQPNFGAAQQVMATICFKKDDKPKAFNWLLKTSLHYFSNITATQIFYVYSYIESLKFDAITQDMHLEFEKFYSNENLNLLRELMKGDGKYNHQGTSVYDEQKYPWPVENAGMARYYRKLSAKADRQNALWEQQLELIDKKENNKMKLYGLMGMRDMENNRAIILEKFKKATAKLDPQMASAVMKRANKLKLPSQEQMMKAYEIMSKKVADGKDATHLSDARQYWALMLWQQYNQYRLDFAAGKMTTEDKNGQLQGTYSQAYGQYHKLIKNAEVSQKATQQIFDNDIKRISEALNAGLKINIAKKAKATTKAERLAVLKESKTLELNFHRQTLDAIKHYIVSNDNAEMAKLRAFRQLYTTALQPAMEDYWTKIIRSTIYCNDKDIVDFFHYTARIENNKYVQRCYDKAAEYGTQYQFTRKLYKSVAENFGQPIEYIEKEIDDIDRGLEAIRNSKVSEADFPQEMFFGADFVIGKVDFSVSEKGSFSVGFTNKVTGTEHNFNLTEKTSTCTQAYPVVTDAERNGKSDAELLRENAAKDVFKELLGKVPHVGSVVSAYDNFESGRKFGSAEDTRFRSVTMDAAGNHQVMSSGLTSEVNYTLGGQGIKLGQSVIYTGNVKIIKHHVVAQAGVFSAGIR